MGYSQRERITLNMRNKITDWVVYCDICGKTSTVISCEKQAIVANRFRTFRGKTRCINCSLTVLKRVVGKRHKEVEE